MKTFSAITFLPTNSEIKLIDVKAVLHAKVIPTFNIIGLPEKTARNLKIKLKAIFKLLKIKFPEGRLIIEFPSKDINYENCKIEFLAFVLVYCFSEFVDTDEFENKIFYGDINIHGEITADLIGLLGADEFKNYVVYSGWYKNLENVLESTSTNLKMFNTVRNFINAKNLRLIQSDLKIKVPPAIVQYKIENVSGQRFAKRALQIAAAGWHNIFISGPTGEGKTLLANSVSELLSVPTQKELITLIKNNNYFNSANNKFDLLLRPNIYLDNRATKTSLFGNKNHPGKFEAASLGCLIMDELCEWDKEVLEKLKIAIDNQFLIRKNLIIGVSNLCPCGKLEKKLDDLSAINDISFCVCSPSIKKRYQQKISRSLYERFPLHINVSGNNSGISEYNDKFEIETFLTEISHAIKAQQIRYKSEMYQFNGIVPHSELSKYIQIDEYKLNLVETIAIEKNFSKRMKHNLLRVAQTIADLDIKNDAGISENHLYEALGLLYNPEILD